jgi:hypothetical protein
MRGTGAAEAVSRAEAAAREAREVGRSPATTPRGRCGPRPRRAYGEALELLPQGSSAEARRLRLERAKAQMFVGKLPDARRDLPSSRRESPRSEARTRSSSTKRARRSRTPQYYSTWLLRLEGASREDWEPEIEAARQNYRLLAEQAARPGDAKLADATREDLESPCASRAWTSRDLRGCPCPRSERVAGSAAVVATGK